MVIYGMDKKSIKICEKKKKYLAILPLFAYNKKNG